MTLLHYSAIYMKKQIVSKQQTQSLRTQLFRLVGSFVLVCLAHQWFLTYDRFIGRVHRHQPRAPMEFLISDKTCAPALRLIVLTMDRAESLHRLLASLVRANYSGDCVALDIWIDRSARGELDSATVAVSHSIGWPFGAKTVHNRFSNAGLRAQWLDTWNLSVPAGLHASTPEVALILEDDLEVSAAFWQWLKAGHAHYAARTDIAGFSLQRHPGTLRILRRNEMSTGLNYLFPFVGSWGFSPTARHWEKFSAWARRFQLREHIDKPYVDGTIFTAWYKAFERQGRCPGINCMWTILHLRYTSMHDDRYTVYANLPREASLVRNFRELGVHYNAQTPFVKTASEQLLIGEIPPTNLVFLTDAPKFYFNGSRQW